jgi:hypothetical protein
MRRAQAIRRELLWRWHARRVGLLLLACTAMIAAAVLLPWALIFVLELLGWTPERGRLILK